MRIAFADFCKMDFHALTVDSSPLGGAHSAACYLSRALARAGHEIFLLSEVASPGIYDGVHCLLFSATTLQKIRSLNLDVFVCMLSANYSPQIRPALEEHTRLVLWNQHASDQDPVQSLRDPAVRDLYDGFAMVSGWQLRGYQEAFNLDPSRCAILRNAIAPVFENLFPDSSRILAQKSEPPVLAYTSTPFRGLDGLIEIFPYIRAAVPGTRLVVYSSMKVYQKFAADDETIYAGLYRRCRECEGVDYLGSIPQPQLAKALRGAKMLVYPSIFRETSCIAVMEAMAAGCQIVTADLAALPETANDFARLVPMSRNLTLYLTQFVEQAVAGLKMKPNEIESLLRRQVDYSNANNTWDIRARQWIQWLENLPRK